MPALRLATSLADQLCVLQDEREDDQLLLPTPGLDWTNNVFVYNSRKNWEDDSIDNLFGAGANTGEVGDDKNIRGEILPLLLDKTTEEEARITEKQRIYSLGLVICEIFSGGEKPVEVERQKQEKRGSKLVMKNRCKKSCGETWIPSNLTRFKTKSIFRVELSTMLIMIKMNSIFWVKRHSMTSFSKIENLPVRNLCVTCMPCR
eukprot:scaffold8111_cov206-Skeletonema_marinoi.AAC.10